MSESRIKRAFLAFPRTYFLLPSETDRADLNVPLSIGYGQTNSQPSTVEQMLEWLNVKSGARVLDVGSGSGWTTALLSHLVGESGDVTAVELVPELVAFGRENCELAGVKNATFHQAGKVLGWPAKAPYDNILVSASTHSLPDSLIAQLANPGTLVIPIGNTIYEIVKDIKGRLTKRAHPGYIFVPLITEN